MSFCGGVRRREVETGVHVEAEPPVGVDMGPEQRGQSPPVFLGEPAGPGRVAQDRLQELGVDEHQARLEEVEGEHGDLGVLAVVPGEDALASVEDLVVGGVPVLHDLQAGVDLAAELLIGEVAAGEDGPHRPAEFFQGGVDRVLGPPPLVKRRSTWSVSAVRSRSAVAYLTIWS